MSAVEPEPESVAAVSPVRRSRLLMGLLLLHAALPAVWGIFAETSGASEIVLFTILVYQYALMATWVGLGPWASDVRMFSALAFNVNLVTSWFVVIRLSGGFVGYDPAFMTIVALVNMLLSSGAISVVCIVPFAVLRYWAHILQVDDPQLLDRGYASKLGIRHLLLVTSVCGVVLAGFVALKDGLEPPYLIALAFVLGPLLMGAVALVWAILLPHFVWTRLALALVVNLGAAALLVIQLDSPPSEFVLGLPGVGLFAASLYALRRQRYRLVRRVEADGATPKDVSMLSPV